MDTLKTIHELCAENHLTLEKLGEKANLDSKRVLAIVEGRWTPSPAERDRVASVFGLNRDEIAWGHKCSCFESLWTWTAVWQDAVSRVADNSLLALHAPAVFFEHLPTRCNEFTGCTGAPFSQQNMAHRSNKVNRLPANGLRRQNRRKATSAPDFCEWGVFGAPLFWMAPARFLYTKGRTST